MTIAISSSFPRVKVRTIVPRPHIDFIVQTLPNARLTVWQDAGHQGVVRHWGEILEAVTLR